MSFFWVFCLLFSVFGAVFSSSTAALSEAALEGAASGIRLAVSLAGPLCLWSGVSNVIRHTGIQQILTRLLSPLLARLFPVAWSDSVARDSLSGNVTANLLGLGNAATPYGIRAVKAMASTANEQASDELCRFVVINTASIQLLPTTVAAVRAGLGAALPFDILPAVWITSICALTAGLLAAKGLSRWVA